MAERSAEELLRAVLAAIPNGERAAPLFAKDGVLELPFLISLGIPTRYQGREAIAEFYGVLRNLYPDFAFNAAEPRVHIATADKVFAEYATHSTAAQTGRLIHHHFMGLLVARNGEIVLLREALNVLGGAQALFPGGLSDLPATLPEVLTVPADYHP